MPVPFEALIPLGLITGFFGVSGLLFQKLKNSVNEGQVQCRLHLPWRAIHLVVMDTPPATSVSAPFLSFPGPVPRISWIIIISEKIDANDGTSDRSDTLHCFPNRYYDFCTSVRSCRRCLYAAP
ncbi:unnamed protein product [Mortierella alpina]